MNSYFIKRVSAHSSSGKVSEIDFEPGMNIICGPSNTGKSMVVGCIDYLFGGDREPFDPTHEDYNGVSMQLVSENGEVVTVRRAIENKDGQAKPSSKVTVVSDADGIESREYKVKRSSNRPDETVYSDILLQMLDIQEPVKIIATQDGKPQRLTLRTFFHQFCIREDDIFRGGTIIDNPNRSAITPCVNSLAYLLYEGGVQEEEYEDPAIKKAKKSALTAYISGKLSTLGKKRKELEERIEEAGTADVEALISEIVDEITTIDEDITRAQQESQRMLGEIYEVSEELAVEKQLQERYRALHTQYDSDISRLCFIIDGEEKKLSGGAEHCPFCDAEITNPEDIESYAAASRAELEKVRLQIADLKALEDETDSRVSSLTARLDNLHSMDDDVRRLVNTELKPKAASLRKELDTYSRIAQLQKELELLEEIEGDFNFDISEQAFEDDSARKYDAKAQFKSSVFNELSSAVCKAIKQCKFPDFKVAGLSLKTFDVVVNDKEKRHEGKGYKAFLNSLFAFVLMRFIDKRGVHAPRMLILDSPILTLKEDVDLPASDSMKSALFDYMIGNCGSCQVIIAENDIPENVDYGSVNIIRFGHGDEALRGGFLLTD